MTERISNHSTTDVLGDILETLRFRSTIFLRSQLAAPWGFAFEQSPTPRFHISLGGEFFLGDGETRSQLKIGDMEIALLPNGPSHWIADRPGRALVPAEHAEEACALNRQRLREATVTNQVMCGRTFLDPDVSHPLFTALPAIVHLPRSSPDSQIWRMVELIDAEVDGGRALTSPIVDRLAEALFLRLLHEAVEHDDDDLGDHSPGDRSLGFVAALRDPQLGRVLQLIHEQPATSWTVDELSARAAMSRATLIRRFRRSVGTAPIEYLTRWRLLKAHQLVRHSAHSIERVAESVGFSSAQTLGRAFKRHFGYPPSRLRAPAAVR